MDKGIFITGTGTDVGKTYVTALIVKKLNEEGIKTGYYKAAISGANSIENSDAGYVKKISKINQKEDTLLSYIYITPVSPHLASKIEGKPVNMTKILKDFNRVKNKYDFIVVEGSGGIVCPIRYDNIENIFLEDIIKKLELKSLIVADAGLGTINSVVLTVSYMKSKNITVSGIILNNYKGGIMEEDNIYMIEKITGVKVISCVSKDDKDIYIDEKYLKLITGGF